MTKMLMVWSKKVIVTQRDHSTIPAMITGTLDSWPTMHSFQAQKYEHIKRDRPMI